MYLGLNQEKKIVNWFGFYFEEDTAQRDLVLGPFHGKAATARIAIGKGVCGTCQVQQDTIIVANVHKCDNHIACDPASNSEICVPIFNSNKVRIL